MTDESSDSPSRRPAPPSALWFIVAGFAYLGLIGAGLLAPTRLAFSPGLFLFGAGLALAGERERRVGVTRQGHQSISRAQHPRAFQVVLWGGRFVPAALLLAGALFLLATGLP